MQLLRVLVAVILVDFSCGQLTLSSPSAFGGGTEMMGIAIGDLDKDGWKDIVATDASQNTVQVFLSKGGGHSFPHNSTTGVGSWQYRAVEGVALGDLNNDGYLDIVAAGYNDNYFSILFSKAALGPGLFYAPVLYPISSGDMMGPVLADFDKDGDIDIAAGGYGASIIYLPNNGTGGFPTCTEYVTNGGATQNVAAADFDGDSWLDIMASDWESNQTHLFLNNQKGGFATPVAYYSGGVDTMGIVAGDFNKDGKPDVALAVYGNEMNLGMSITVLLNKGGAPLTFTQASYPCGQNYGEMAMIVQDVAMADFNGDGNIDLVGTLTWDYSAICVLLGNGDGTFQPQSLYQVITNNNQFNAENIAAADLDNDGYTDVAYTVAGPTSSFLQAMWSTDVTSTTTMNVGILTTSSALTSTSAALSTTSAVLSSTTAALSSSSAAMTSTSAALTSTTVALSSTSAALSSTSAALSSTSAALSSAAAALSSTSAALSSTSAALSSTSAALSSTSAAALSSTSAALSSTSAFSASGASSSNAVSTTTALTMASTTGPSATTSIINKGSSQHKALSTGIIIGIVVGAVFLLAAVAALVSFIVFKVAKTKKSADTNYLLHLDK